MSEILIIVKLQHAASRVWTCAEHEFRLIYMKLCDGDNYHTTMSQYSCLKNLRRRNLEVLTFSMEKLIESLLPSDSASRNVIGIDKQTPKNVIALNWKIFWNSSIICCKKVTKNTQKTSAISRLSKIPLKFSIPYYSAAFGNSIFQIFPQHDNSLLSCNVFMLLLTHQVLTLKY